MRLGSLAWMLALVGLSVAVGDVTPPPRGTLPPPIATRQTLFSIPFQIPPGGQSIHDPVEIQLYVSADRGANWQLCQRVKPEKGHFLFRAVTDGEYWFVIRTLDRSGQLRPQRTEGPGLRVVVDTTLPDLQLQASQAEAGQITVRWQVSESRLDPDSLKIRCRFGPNLRWQTVAIDRQSTQTSGRTRTGEVSWWPESGSKLVEIRAEVADTAGNWAVSHAKVNLDRQLAAGSTAKTDASQRVNNELAGPASPPASQWRSSDDASPPNGPQERLYGDAPREYDPETLSNDPLYAGVPYADEVAPSEVGPPIGAGSPSIYASEPQPTSQGLGADGPLAIDAKPPGFDRPSAWPANGSMAANVNPPIQRRYVLPQQGAGNPTPKELAAGERPKWVNSRLFELEYHVDAMGTSGIGQVELWGTRDGGLTWDSYSIDRDTQSPMLVSVQDEGIYGFRVAVQSSLGMGGERPKSGDPPEVWVGVDLTQPEARILSARLGTGADAGQLIVHWEAKDQMLSARPVSLWFSETLGSRWTPIASELENTGHYAWPLDRRLPPRVYLRLEVRDEAGNLATCETPQPVTVDRLRPSARIRNVRPVADTARTSRRHPFR